MMKRMQGDWTRLGAAVRDVRKARGLTQEELGDLAGTTRTTIQTIERGTEFTRVTPTLRSVERVLDWMEGSVEQLLAGGDATPATPPVEPQPAPALAEGMPLQVVHELSEGQVIGSEVIDLTEPGSDEHLIVIYKQGASGPVDPAALRRKLKRWTTVQRLLHNLPIGDDDDSEVEGA